MYWKSTKSRLLMATFASFTFGAAQAQEMPGTLIWSTYDVGSAGYAEAAAIADALGKEFGTRIRMLPSSNALGRIDPVLEGKADLGFLATEVFFASEGSYEFATPDRGPRAIRILAGRSVAFGIATAGDANIMSVADIAGKRFAIPVGNSSVIAKCAAGLAFGGVTWDDVELVETTGYVESLRAVGENRADAVCTNPAAPPLYEIAEGPRGIRWMPFSPEDKEGWARLQAVAPGLAPLEYGVIAGLKEGETMWLPGYRYPQLSVRPDMSVDVAYSITKALDEAYPQFKDAIKGMELWRLDQAGLPPMDAPIHEGAIKYMTEKGYWTDEASVWQQRRLAREAAIADAWDSFMPENSDLPAEEFNAAWEKARSQIKLD